VSDKYTDKKQGRFLLSGSSASSLFYRSGEIVLEFDEVGAMIVESSDIYEQAKRPVDIGILNRIVLADGGQAVPYVEPSAEKAIIYKKEPKITVTKKPTIKKPSATKNKITVNWKHFNNKTKKGKKIWKPIKKVQVQCAADKGFSNIVKTAMVGKGKTKATIKGLQKNTTYYVRARYYDGTGYSAWSSIKKVKTKK
jgi:hypothetical protein